MVAAWGTGLNDRHTVAVCEQGKRCTRADYAGTNDDDVTHGRFR
jgi:hypothetical protein